VVVDFVFVEVLVLELVLLLVVPLVFTLAEVLFKLTGAISMILLVDGRYRIAF